MKNTIGLIFSEAAENSDLRELLQNRSIGTLPFGSRYRLIDFTLSNMVNSGIKKIGVVASSKYSSVIDHLGTGKDWLLSRKTGDLAILKGSESARIGEAVKFNVKDIIDNRAWLNRNPSDTVLISNSNLVTTYDFNEPYEIYTKNNADVVLIYRKDEARFHSLPNDLYLTLDGLKVTDVKRYAEGDVSENKFVDMMLIKKSVLMDMLDAAETRGEWDLIDVIAQNLSSLKVLAALHTGYISRITNVEKYYQTNMDLLDYDILKELFMSKNPIYTKVKDNHPTHYEDHAKIKDCILGSGAVIDGEMTNTVAFREVKVGEDSKISNSILMQKCEIGRNVTLDHVIFDKECVIRDNTTLIGTIKEPIILSKGTTI